MSETIYDQVAYPSFPYRQAHPLRLGVAAALRNAPFAPVDRARVLEIGCGEGANIIPLAVHYPQGQFVGFDLASTAVEAGRRMVDQLGLSNIRLEARDILQAGADLGEFDYIIAHGVYSWVPEPVREGLLKLVSACLSPTGLAFVSYNALPGCHFRRMMREMMRRHLRGVEGYEARLAKAQELLHFLSDTALDNEIASQALKEQSESMLQRDPRVLFHDELGEVWEPFYLHEFVDAAERHGLQYVGDADAAHWREEWLPTERGEAVTALVGTDPLANQQYLDFINLRFFRQTILSRAGVPLTAPVEPRWLRGLWARARARLEDPQANLEDHEPVMFNLEEDIKLSLDHPLLKQALVRIGAHFPQAVAIADLPDDPDIDKGLMQLFAVGRLELETGPTPAVLSPGERPLACPLARLQAASSSPRVTSILHRSVTLQDETARAFLTLLDGTRDRQALVQELRDRGAPVTLEQVDFQLGKLAERGLMMG
jgi:SAM-dependent methyltransferase